MPPRPTAPLPLESPSAAPTDRAGSPATETQSPPVLPSLTHYCHPQPYQYVFILAGRSSPTAPDKPCTASPPHPYSEPASASTGCTDRASPPASSAHPPASPAPAPPASCHPRLQRIGPKPAATAP